MHLIVLGGVALLWVVVLMVRYELRLLDNAWATAAVVASLVACATVLRCTGQSTEEVSFNDDNEPAVQALGLNRDGAWEVGESR